MSSNPVAVSVTARPSFEHLSAPSSANSAGSCSRTGRPAGQPVAGFTLIEVLIVVGVVAILAGIALPAYREYVMRGNIPDATTELGKIKTVRESYFQDHYSYAGAPCPKDNKHFTFQCTVAPDPTDPSGVATLDPDKTYLVIAKGIGSMTGFEYTINEMLGKTSKTPWGISGSCWITKTDGSC